MKKLILLLLVLATTQTFAKINFVTSFPRVKDGHHDYRYAWVGIVKTNHVHRASPGYIHENETIVTHAENISVLAPDPAGKYNIQVICYNAMGVQSLPFSKTIDLLDGATLHIQLNCKLDHFGNPITPLVKLN